MQKVPVKAGDFATSVGTLPQLSSLDCVKIG
jgi:hypothetical protein